MSPDKHIRDFQHPESLPHILGSGTRKVYLTEPMPDITGQVNA